MKLITTLALAAGIALGGIGMASAQELVNEIGGVTIEGNSKVNMFRPEKEQEVIPRNFQKQPPLIPHSIKGYNITQNFNKCMDCHSAARYVEMNTTRVPPSHFKTRTGQELSNLSPSRYFCTQCHVPQVDARPLVNNAYQSSTRK